MSIKGIFKTNKVFIRFIISYIVVLSFTVLVGMIAYSETVKMVKENAIKEGLASLEKGKDILDTRFSEVDKLVIQITLQEELQYIYNIENPLKNTDYYRFDKAFKKLSSFMLTNNFIDDLYVVYRDIDILISSRYISNEIDSFYKDFLCYDGMTYSQWYEKIFGEYHYRSIWPTHKVTSNNSRSSKVTYIQSTPLSSYENYKGVVLALIDEKQIQHNLSTLDIQNVGGVYILDNQGQVISSASSSNYDITSMALDMQNPRGFSEMIINRENVVVMHTTSSVLEWKYVAVLPSVVFKEKAAYVRRLFSTTIAITLLIGAIIALYFSYQNIRPVRRLLKRLKEEMEGEHIQVPSGEYDFIEGTISKLISNNKDLKKERENQVPFLRVGFFERLLRGEFFNATEMRKAMTFARLDIKGEAFQVILMRLNGFSGELIKVFTTEYEVARLMGERVLKRYMGSTSYLHNIDEDKIAVLKVLNYRDMNKYEEIIEKNIEQVINELYKKYNIGVSFGVGRESMSLLNINSSFQEAAQALAYKNTESIRRVMWFKDIPQKDIGYYYPMNLEIRLMNLVRTGDLEEIQPIIKSVYVKNFIQKDMSTSEIQQLFYEIRGTIMKVRGEVLCKEDSEYNDLELLINQMDNCESVEGISEIVMSIYQILCTAVKHKKKRQDKDLAQSIVDFVNANYMYEDICLYRVASEFKITERFLSQFFKDQTGEAFSSYVEKMRMKQAVQLLEQQDLSVTDIARRIGYTNNNTFYKAFKRLYGISPSTYRRDLV